MSPTDDAGAPVQDEVERITGDILEGLGACDVESALTVVCNIAGHLVAHLSDRKPSMVQHYGDSVADNIKKAAIAKLLHDDQKRRETRRAAQEEALAVELKNGD